MNTVLPQFVQSTLLALPLVLLGSGCNKKAESESKSGDRLAARIESIRQGGEPVTLVELNAWYAEPAAGENGAGLYEQAFSALNGEKTDSPTFLKNNTKVVALLHQAASGKKCRYSMDLGKGSFTTMPHLTKIKACCQLLRKATASHAASGRTDLATQTVIDGWRLSQSLLDEPTLISQMVRIAGEILAQDSLEEALNQRAFSEQQLASLVAEFNDSGNAMILRRAFVSERCMGLALLDAPAKDLAQVLGRAEGFPKDFDPAAYRKTPTYEADMKFFLDHVEGYIAAADSPFPKNLDAVAQWPTRIAEAKQKGYCLSGLLTPSLHPALERIGEAVARMRVTQSALAVERYRMTHQGALPDSLGQLVPEELPAVPEDPFDGKPLRYTKASPGFLVYSIGKDRKDDSGKERSKQPGADSAYDLIFAVGR